MKTEYVDVAMTKEEYDEFLNAWNNQHYLSGIQLIPSSKICDEERIILNIIIKE